MSIQVYFIILMYVKTILIDTLSTPVDVLGLCYLCGTSFDELNKNKIIFFF